MSEGDGRYTAPARESCVWGRKHGSRAREHRRSSQRWASGKAKAPGKENRNLSKSSQPGAQSPTEQTPSRKRHRGPRVPGKGAVKTRQSKAGGSDPEAERETGPIPGKRAARQATRPPPRHRPRVTATGLSELVCQITLEHKTSSSYKAKLPQISIKKGKE